MQGKNLKMCLRSTDKTTDTSEVAKVCSTIIWSRFVLYFMSTIVMDNLLTQFSFTS